MSQSNDVCEICGAGNAAARAGVCPNGIGPICEHTGGGPGGFEGIEDAGAGPGPFETGQAGEAGETGTGE